MKSLVMSDVNDDTGCYVFNPRLLIAIVVAAWNAMKMVVVLIV